MTSVDIQLTYAQNDLKVQWRSQNLDVVGTLEVWGVGKGVSSPRKRGLGRRLCPSPENFWIYGV